jgi:hypothetical protein
MFTLGISLSVKLVCGPTTVDRDRGARDRAREVRAQIGAEFADFARLDESACGHLIEKRFLERFFFGDIAAEGFG